MRSPRRLRPTARLRGPGPRKTTPGLRLAREVRGARRRRAEPAPRAGRDGILIKENHRCRRRRIGNAAQRAGARPASGSGRGRDDRAAAGAAGRTAGVLLDNFTLERMREAVAISAGRALLRLLGRRRARPGQAIAATGVDRIDRPADQGRARIDFSMRDAGAARRGLNPADVLRPCRPAGRRAPPRTSLSRSGRPTCPCACSRRCVPGARARSES